MEKRRLSTPLGMWETATHRPQVSRPSVARGHRRVHPHNASDPQSYQQYDTIGDGGSLWVSQPSPR